MNQHFSPTNSLLARRQFLTNSLWGMGAATLSQLLQAEGYSPSQLLQASENVSDPLRAKSPHFTAKAKNCIYIYLEGGPSQMDLYDPKPQLNKLDGQPLPESLLEKVQFAFLQKESARLMGTPRTFQKYGECGMDFSDLLPTCRPAQTTFAWFVRFTATSSTMFLPSC